uniref:Uncharacterized protein n=1 Tax=Trichobilharzia regenti TaxID=157069 RepID=A0AA85JIQ9_TRIRE|nr:unnamed protein product [Trichobilharzia regenti]
MFAFIKISVFCRVTTQGVKTSGGLEGKKCTPLDVPLMIIPGCVLVPFRKVLRMETFPVKLSQQPKGFQQFNRIPLTRQANEVKHGGDSDELLRSAKTPTSPMRKNSQFANERSTHCGRQSVNLQNNPETNLDASAIVQPGGTWNIGMGGSWNIQTTHGEQWIRIA